MTPTTWTYGVAIHEEDGDFVVSVRDLPEVVTAGSNLQEALELAADAIEVIVIGRMQDENDLPDPSKIKRGEHAVALSAPLAAKAAVFQAWKRSGLKKTDLAKIMHRNEIEVRRILNPRHGTKLDQMAETARALGGRLVVTFEAA